MLRMKPQILLAYEALIRNIFQGYMGKEEILALYSKYRSGFTGEQNLDYKLNLLPSYYEQISDIRLKGMKQTRFQMDKILLTSKVIIVLESKYIRGEILYQKDTRQLVQIFDGKTKAYKDPVLQAFTQRKNLKHWLALHGYHVPIVALAVSTNDEALLKHDSENDELSNCFVTLEEVIYRVEKIYQSFNNDMLSTVDIKKIAHLLKKENDPLLINVLDQHHIRTSELEFGIRCTICNRKMSRTYGTWRCSYCEINDKEAHIQKLYDYFLLIGDTMNNEQCRVWLQLGREKMWLVSRILKNSPFEATGKTKLRKYHRPAFDQFPQNASVDLWKRASVSR